MSVYKNLEAMTDVAIHLAKEHNCNYNVILYNPDENGEFSESRGSTYEMVADSFFKKDRPNVKLIYKTDDLIEKEVEAEEIIESSHRFLFPEKMYEIKNTYKDIIVDNEFGNLNPGITYVRQEPKIGNNDSCKCGSGKKYKKCCK